MQKIEIQRMLKGIGLSLCYGLFGLSLTVNATTFATIQSNVLNSNSQAACTACHSSALVGTAARHAATVGVDFNTYALAALWPDRITARISGDSMPNDPTAADFTFAGALTAGEKAIAADWDADGAPLSAATATTSTTVSARTKTTLTVNGTVDTNVHSATTVSGTYFVQYSVNTSYASSTSSTNRSSTASASVSKSITGLSCGTTYNYRFRATNGHGTSATTTARSTFTSACSAPVINVNGSPDAGPLAIIVSKGQQLTNTDFLITATDTDTTTTLDWSIIGTPPAAGAASTTSINTANPAITYTAPAVVPVPATVSFTVQVEDETPGTTLKDTIVVNVTIIDNAPIINQGATLDFSINEDSINNVLQLTATDLDGDPLTWSTQVFPAGAYSGSVNAVDDTKFDITYSPVPDADTVNADTFTVRVSDGTGFDEIVVSVDITASPDDPVANNDPNFEVLVNSTDNTLDVLANDTDVDTGDTKTLAAQTITGSNGGAITVNNAGAVNNDINYTPVAGATVAETFTYTVTDSDGRTNTALVTVSPPDTDGDGVVDYIDNCAATPNAGQADNDGDQVINVNTTSNPTQNVGVSTPGGDACDVDDDNDGMPDAFENTFGFDKNNSADASQDQDGDGVSNLQEFLDGTDPTVDTVGPTLTVPANVTVGATGYFTVVDIGVATANDGNEGAINVVIPVVDGSITCAQLGGASDTIEPLRPGSYTVTWHSCDSKSNLSAVDQSVTVRPLITTTPGQVTSVPNSGSFTTVRFEVMLNGIVGVDVDVDYTITGSATVAIDYAVFGNPAATSGTITIASGDTIGFIEIDILNLGVPEDVNTILLTLSNPVDAVLGSITVHEILIATFNVSPIVDINVAQNGEGVGSIITTGVPNLVTITANAFDANSDDLLNYDWSATDNALMPPVTVGVANSFNIDTSSLTPGLYTVEVSVSDGVVTTTRSMLIVAQGPIAVSLPSNVDTDADGIDDDDPLEGFGDEDGDGIPNYLDNVFLAPNVINNQTGDLGNSFIIETDPGLDIRKGTTAVAAGVAGVLISQAQLEANGGQAGGVAVNAVDSNANTSGLYDFEISGLNPSISSANVVIPLPSALQANSVYRKYNTVDGWFTFVQNNNNRVSSASGELGVCPAPGSTLYTSGLTPFHYCVQLTIQDGGPNDADKIRNFVIRDPGGVVVQPTSTNKSSDSDGRIGVMHPLLLLIMLLPFAYVYRVQIRREFARVLSRKKQNRR